MNWESGDSITGVYSDARTEYTKQLCVFLVPAYFQFFIQLLEKAKVATTAEAKKCLWQFQNYLNEIPEWNMEKVSNEIATLQSNCGCDYLEDLLTAVFIAHTKVLTAIRISSKQKKVQINVPKVEHFLYKVLCESSKLLWGSTYLFRDGISSIEKQQNYRNVEKLLTEGVGQAVRAMVPVKSILRDFVAADEGGEEDEVEEAAGAPVTAAAAGTTQPEDTSAAQPSQIEEAAVATAAAAAAAPAEAETIVPEESQQQQPVNEVITPPTIVVDTTTGVSFSGYDTILDQDNPDKSDILEQREYAEPELEILDEVGVPIDDDSDVEDLDRAESPEEDARSVGSEMPIGSDEFDVIV
jgi:hypothetical protein